MRGNPEDRKQVTVTYTYDKSQFGRSRFGSQQLVHLPVPSGLLLTEGLNILLNMLYIILEMMFHSSILCNSQEEKSKQNPALLSFSTTLLHTIVKQKACQTSLIGHKF